jgi:hypothetical protein
MWSEATVAPIARHVPNINIGHADRSCTHLTAGASGGKPMPDGTSRWPGRPRRGQRQAGHTDHALAARSLHRRDLGMMGEARVVALLQSNAWPLGRCRPPTVLAMGQNRQKTGKACLLTPSTSSGRMGPNE